MYVPSHFEESDLGTLHALLRAHPLGTWVTQSRDVADGGELIANHVPFLLDPTRGEHGTLLCHVARANPVWRSFSTTQASLVVFQGPQGYITPSWYPSKQAHGKVVPTWNYAVVHAHGQPRVIDDPAWLLHHVGQMTHGHETPRPAPWQVGDAPADFVDSLLRAIVGIEIPISRLVGKWKVSQNRPAADRAGVVDGLVQQGDDASRAMAELVCGSRAG